MKNYICFMSKMLFWGIALTFMQSCDKATNDNDSNPFVGTWVASGTYDGVPGSLDPIFFRMYGDYNYTITITKDYRCHVEGTNNVSVVYAGNTNTETRSDNYYLAYDMDGNNCIQVKGRTHTSEDGAYLGGTLGLLKDDNTLTGNVYFQGPKANAQNMRLREEVDFKRQ